MDSLHQLTTPAAPTIEGALQPVETAKAATASQQATFRHTRQQNDKGSHNA
jgi:hypothetical protein